MKHLWLVALLVSIAGSVAAIDRIDVGADRIEGQDLSVEGFEFAFSFGDDGRLELVLRADGLAQSGRTLDQPELRCVDLRVTPERIDCPEARLTFRHAQVSASNSPATFSYAFAARRLHVAIGDLIIAGGHAALDFTLADADWTLAVDAKQLDLAGLAALAEAFGVTPPALNPAGRVSGSVRLTGNALGVRGADWRLVARDVVYSNADGTQAAQDLALDLTGDARAGTNRDWRFKAQVHASQGLLYTDPLYFDFKSANALTLDADGLWQAARQRVRIDRLALDHAGIAQAEARLALRLGEAPKLEMLTLDLHQGLLPGFYTTYVQPWAAGTLLEQIDSSGAVKASLEWRDDALQALRLQLDDASFEQHSGRFGVGGLSGTLHWGNDDTPRDSVLVWERANYYQLALGKARVDVETRGRQARLREPLSVDVLDGRLHIDTFELDMSAPDDTRWRFDGVLAPISMEAFSKAIGWPPLAGQLSGVVPDVEYAQHRLKVGGTLLVQAFGGDIKVQNLRIDEPAGLVPRLWADVRLDHLDLKTLTRTFSFGRIKGQLQGSVDGLYMEDWQPVAFDARFETPPGDHSTKRISQKAVDSISNLGGAGVSGALSRGFLRFLDDFPYRRLGIACRLEKGVCHMDGVGPAPGGYYLVQGRFIPPRLDMIGYSHEVDWKSLIDRLAAVTSLPAPSVQ